MWSRVAPHCIRIGTITASAKEARPPTPVADVLIGMRSHVGSTAVLDMMDRSDRESGPTTMLRAFVNVNGFEESGMNVT